MELWDGRVVWMRRGPAEHQTFTNRIWAALERCVRADRTDNPERCLRVTTETDVFLGTTGKNDFLTPDFSYTAASTSHIRTSAPLTSCWSVRCCRRATPQTDMEAKRARYASAGIPWYWEASLDRSASAIASIRAYGLESTPGLLPDGDRPLRQANYLLAGEWTLGRRRHRHPARFPDRHRLGGPGVPARWPQVAARSVVCWGDQDRCGQNR